MRKLLLKLHLYAAAVAGLFLVILGITGSIMAFEPELDHLFHARLFYVTPRPPALTLTRIGEAVSRAFPGEPVNAYLLPTSPDLSCQAVLHGRLVFVNPYSGEILGVRPPGPDFLGYVHQLHIRLLLASSGNGDVGKKIMTWADVAMVFLLLSGVYLWWPTKRITIEWRASARRLWYDVHNVAGICTLGFLLALTLTGAIIGFESSAVPMLYKLSGSRPSRAPGPPPPPGPGSTAITPDQAVEAARAALPGALPFMVNLPGPKEAYRISARYPEDLTPGGRSRVVIDQYSGKVLWAEGSRTAPAGARLVIANRAIHTGDLLGIPGKTLMSLASLAVVIQAWSGLVMWLKKDRRRRLARR